MTDADDDWDEMTEGEKRAAAGITDAQLRQQYPPRPVGVSHEEHAWRAWRDDPRPLGATIPLDERAFKDGFRAAAALASKERAEYEAECESHEEAATVRIDGLLDVTAFALAALNDPEVLGERAKGLLRATLSPVLSPVPLDLAGRDVPVSPELPGLQ